MTNVILHILITILLLSSINGLYSNKNHTQLTSSSSSGSKIIYSKLQSCDEIQCFSSKPRFFSIDYKKVGKHYFEIEFNYTARDYYNKYFLTIKTHDKKEYITKKVNLDKKEANRVIFKKFNEDQYIVCVVLYSTNYDVSNEFPPISTSDMCVDMFIGDFLVINTEEEIQRTGLLAPVLLAIVFLSLVLITMIDKLKKANISKCFKEINNHVNTNDKQLETKRIKLKTNTYYSNKYGLREDLVEVLIYYDQVEFVFDDNTSYYLRKEMFYFIQNYIEEVTNRLKDDEVQRNVIKNDNYLEKDFLRQQQQSDKHIYTNNRPYGLDLV
jgi:hypothetical protein